MLERVAAVDPEDLQMHYTAMLAARGLGDEARAARAEKLFLRFKADESAQAITARPRLLKPEDNNERQPIHEHEIACHCGAVVEAIDRRNLPLRLSSSRPLLAPPKPQAPSPKP